ncbi:MAG: hypothetical protein L0Z50_03560 [Verrucomicrobiales bacterium]|nr:hypothetical protein [Verrucomicrobiales bacterium]
MLFTRDGHNVFLGDMFRGGTAFLVCGGPSLRSHDLTKLQQRGIVTCAVNNAAAVVRPNLWVSVDDPGNFCDAIWRDPAIWKFVPLCHMEKNFTVRNEAGELVPSQESVGDMPLVFGYRRNEAFVAEQWLYEDTFNWGNHSEGVDAYGIKGSRSVMLVALRMLFYLGIRRLFLIGCDFRMAYEAQNYAFDQSRSRSSVNGNKSSYAALNVRLAQLKSHFDRENFAVYNCTPNSGLQVFPSRSYDEAIEEALGAFPRTMNTSGMYDRNVNGGGTRASKGESTSPIVIENGWPLDPVAALGLPEVTLVTAVDWANLDTFRWTWKSWMLMRAWLRTMPALVIHEPDDKLAEQLQSIVGGQSAVHLIPEAPNNALTGRDRWSHAYLRVPAEHARTPWYLRLEPEAVAREPARWLLPEWFSSDSRGQILAFVSHVWGYTRPASALARLDAWGDRIAGLKNHSPLNLPVQGGESRLNHDAISSWFFLGNTGWTREVLSYAKEDLPCTSHETFLLYCAIRRGDSYIRWPMKNLGWDHSFSRRWSAAERGRAVVERATAALATAADQGRRE